MENDKHLFISYFKNDKEFTSYFEEISYWLAFSKNINTDEQELEKYGYRKKKLSTNTNSGTPGKDPQQNTEGKFIKEEDLKPLLELARIANAINAKLKAENQALKDRIASLELKQFEAFMEGQDKAIAEKEAKIVELSEDATDLSDAPQDRLPNVLVIATLCRLFEKLGTDFDERGVKSRVADFISKLTGIPIKTCKNNIPAKGINRIKQHEENIRAIEFHLRQIGIENCNFY